MIEPDSDLKSCLMREIVVCLKVSADIYFCRFCGRFTLQKISYRIIYHAEFFLFLYRRHSAQFFFKENFL